MFSPKMQLAINQQINYEQASAQVYLAMAAWCEHKNYRGFATWLKVQANEENEHAMKLMNFLLERGGRLELFDIKSPQQEFKSLLEVFEKALEHEQKVTERINALFDLARQEKDYATEIALHWYINEQIEEESQIGHIFNQLKAIGEGSNAVWYLDNKMGKRQVREN